MTESRRVFDVEFKLNVAQMVVDQGQSVKDVAKAMGLGETAVRRWAEQYKNNRLGKVVAGTPLTAEQLRIRRKVSVRLSHLDTRLIRALLSVRATDLSAYVSTLAKIDTRLLSPGWRDKMGSPDIT